MGHWADQVLTRRSLRVEIDFAPGRLTLNPHANTFDEFSGTIHFARAVGRIHQISRVLESGFQFGDALELTAGEIADIDLAYNLLEGKRIAVSTEFFEFSPDRSIDMQAKHEFFMTSTLVFEINGERLGTIPVAVEFPGFILEEIPETGMLRVRKGAEGQAWMYRFDHSDPISGIRRNPSSPIDQQIA